MDFTAARRNMISGQLRANKVGDARLIDAIARTPREVFLPRQLRGLAYLDQDVDLGGGRFLIQPLGLALLAQAAMIRADDVVLIIGDVTGWAAAVLSLLASTVVSVENDSEIISRAGAALGELAVDNVALVTGELAAGYPTQAPYDVIVFAGAVAEIPPAVAAQLGEGGRLVAVVRAEGGAGKGTKMVRAGESLGRQIVFDAGIGWLPGLAPHESFAL